MAPAGLDASDFGIIKGGDGTLQKVRRGHEIGVKDGDEFAAGMGEPSAQGASFVPFALSSVVLGYVDAVAPVKGDAVGDDLAGIVGRIVKDLNLEPVCGPVESGDGVDQTAHDVSFIEDR